MHILRILSGVTLVAALSWAGLTGAQVDSSEDQSEASDSGATDMADGEAPTEIPEELFKDPVMDEITVVAGPQGQTAFELEMEREELMRQAIYDEMRLREREQEEQAWRQADPDLRNPDSRIKWGYSPQAEQRMRRSNDFMYDLPIDQTKPATLFRAEF